MAFTPPKKAKRRLYKALIRGDLLLSILFLTTTIAIMLTEFAARGHEEFLSQPYMFVILCTLLGIVLMFPTIYLILCQRFDFFHPLVYPVLIYMFPSFVLGGFYSRFGSNPPWVLSMILKPDYYISLSILYVMIGFIGMMIGFAIPSAARIGKALSRRLPDWDWSPFEFRGPCVFLLLIGLSISALCFSIGVMGYQLRENLSICGNLLISLALLTNLGSFMLWWAFFQRKETKQSGWNMVIGLLIAQILFITLTNGSRATLLAAVISIFASYWFLKRHLSVQVMFVLAIMVVISLLTGMNIGTTFRKLKGSEQVLSCKENFMIGLKAASLLSNASIGENIALSIDKFLSRFESLSQFAVVVANYKRLRPIEERYGIANNIWTYTWTAFIPRFIWPNKPKISDARTIGKIYFNAPWNSFATTPFGDLLRNFGPIGVLLGMTALGFVLRIIYIAFVGNQSPSAWRAAAYFILLTSINYEGFYGSILPFMIRQAFSLFLGGILIKKIIEVLKKIRFRLR